MDNRRNAVTNYVEAQLGKPYVYGATGPDAFDCSGLVYAGFRSIGISIPRTSESQWSAAKHLDKSQLQPGDIVFTTGSGDPIPGHEGLYVGGGQIVEAPHTGDVVKEVPMSYFVGKDPWDTLVGYGSFFPKDTPPASSAPGPTPAPPSNPGTAPAGGSDCATDNFSVGACNASIGNLPSNLTGYACCANGFGSSPDVNGTCSDANCSRCCGSGIGNNPGGNQVSGGGGSGSCQCAHIHIPLLGGFNLLPCFICDFFDAITSEAFWVRAGEVILGIILVVVGLRMFVSGNLLPKGATAATVAAVA